MKKITVHIADDHQLVVDGLKAILEKENIEVKGASLTGAQTINWCKKNTADILLLDITMPDINGIEVLKILRDNNIQQKTIMFSGYLGFDFIKHSLENGASGYILKSDTQNIVNVIKQVLRGNVYYSDEVKNFLVEKYKKTSSKPVYILLTEALTASQLEIVKMFVNNHTTKEIAEKQNVSPITVRGQLKRLKDKLNVKSNVGLAMKYSFLLKK